MKFSVFELPKAQDDKRAIFVWLSERSTRGARAWLSAYDSLLIDLESNATVFGPALENPEFPEFDLKQAFFKTRRGRTYRIIYFIDGRDVFVLRVRGPGQAPVLPNEIQ